MNNQTQTLQTKSANLGFGLGLRFEHYETILTDRPKGVDWFEIISENFMESHQGYWDFLADIKRDYPIIPHGVSLSLGSPDPLNRDYLKKLKKLVDFLNPPWFSDHICWTSAHGVNTHDLMPVPYTDDALAHFIQRAKEVQDFMERPLALENPSTYLSFQASTMSEYEFIARVAEESDSFILLDVNNVHVSAFNHRYDPQAYLAAMPADRVVQMHLAGHQHKGTHILDTHDNHVNDEVWALYRNAVERLGRKATMVEWDAKIPTFDVLLRELDQARNLVPGVQAA